MLEFKVGQRVRWNGSWPQTSVAKGRRGTVVTTGEHQYSEGGWAEVMWDGFSLPNDYDSITCPFIEILAEDDPDYQLTYPIN